ncbi:hypothetical protein F4680DRAFT_446971 [Xylaria scruposa]|nr:hypothetical protein F4680DRAFT_446971 [Xylaria scruposa]
MNYSVLYPHQQDPHDGSDVYAQPRPHVGSYEHFKADESFLRSSPTQQPRRSTSRPRPLPQQDGQSWGKPAVKKRIQPTHLLAAIASLISLALSIIAIENEDLSWFLGQDANQLIVIGFLLSIMNICLSMVLPMSLLLLEARFGQSKIQNYDGILRNQILGSRLSFQWRLLLSFIVALPIGLSILYKRFIGGQSAKLVTADMFGFNDSYYGMFAPPGVQHIGQQTGVSIFFNATLPFAVSIPLSSVPIGEEPSLPMEPQPFGYNILLLSDESAAVLDMPHNDYVSSIQSMLAPGELWNMTAPVLGTIAAFDHTKDENLKAWNKTFMDRCLASEEGKTTYSHQTLMNDWAIYLIDDEVNQTFQYIGVAPDFGINKPSPCSNFSHYAQLYSLTRQQCKGTWSISRGNIQLSGGSCNNSTPLSLNHQVIIAVNHLALPFWYMQSLMELLGPLATIANQSIWARPYYATVTSVMLWSRITALNGAAKDGKAGDEMTSVIFNDQKLTYEAVGLIYPVPNELIYYIRPTLLKSRFLYFILALQPILLLIALGFIFAFRSVPIGKGFGLIAILAGINHRTLSSLRGAAFSGELTEDLKLIARPLHDDSKARVEYSIVSNTENWSEMEKVMRGVTYH